MSNVGLASNGGKSNQGQLLLNEQLADYTTWRVGGTAYQLYKPANIADLALFMKQLPATEPVLWLGLGSNALIRDKGFAGTVILTRGKLNGLSLVSSTAFYVEAGVSCASLARFCARNHLSGGEFWAGIPGTLGGALRMNAGCHGSETWDSVLEVQTMTRQGEIRVRSAKEFNIAYRHAAGLADDEWFISATCKLSAGDKDSALQRIKSLLEHRNNTQPTSEHNCGSVFRNPPGHFAAQLIESCALKGYRLGGAMVSLKHANFIINRNGQASACDIESLITFVQACVLEKTSMELIREVHIIGEE